MKLFFPSFILFLFLLPVRGRSEAAAPRAEEASISITPVLIDRLLAEARTRNLALAVAGARADAATAAADAVRTWEDPTATFGLSLPTARGFKASEEGNLLYGIEQKLPVFDRPKLARAVASAGASREKLTLDYETGKLRRDLTTALVALALADETTEYGQQDLAWLDATLTSVDHRYRVGKASQVEWLKIQTERAKITDRITTLQREREHRQVELNRILNRDLHAPWPRLALPPPATSTPPDEAAVVAAAVQAEPRLKVIQQQLIQAEATARLTREMRRPAIGIGLQGRSYSGDGGFRDGMVTVNFSVPWLNSRHYADDYAHDRAKIRMGEHELADYTLGLREEIHHLLIDLDAARRQTALYRNELIPLTEQTLASASTAWANNLGAFQDLLDARRALVEDQLVLAQSIAEQARLESEIYLLTGGKDLSSAFTSPGAPRSDQIMPMPTHDQ